MNVYKIVGMIGLLIAVVGAFVTIPYATPLLAVIGVVIGVSVAAEHHVRVIVSALALHMLASSFDMIPAVGGVVSAVLANLGFMAAGAALLIIVRNMIDRIKP